VLVGIETALADDPELTVRLEGHAGPQPARVVLDSRQRLSPLSRLARSAREVPTLVLTATPPRPELQAAGVQVLQVEAGADGRPSIPAAVQALKAAGLDRLMVEGGGQVAASFIASGLVDRIEWFRAPMVLGDDGRPCIGALGLEGLAEAPRFHRAAVEVLGQDLWERYERA
jgi:diaminohydroxyphosphoribosylaminopyrimidine deaminase/5-amino-6-(5-phosphoribosylamino)uracil reductase